MAFFQNLVDSLSLGSDLTAIRAKQAEDRPLKEMSDSQIKLIRYGNVFGLTVIVIILGLARYYWRRRTNNFQL